MFFYPLQKLVFCRINSYGPSFYHYLNDFLLLFLCGHGIGFPGFSRAHVISILCLLLTFFASNWLKSLSNLPSVFYQKGFIITFSLLLSWTNHFSSTLGNYFSLSCLGVLGFLLLVIRGFGIFFSLFSLSQSFVLFHSLDHTFNKNGLLLIYLIVIHRSGISYFSSWSVYYILLPLFPLVRFLIFIIFLGVFPLDSIRIFTHIGDIFSFFAYMAVLESAAGRRTRHVRCIR